MQIAIDKTCLQKLDILKGHELIYIFDEEPLKELLELKMHCVHKSEINEVDINLTNYTMNAKKTEKIGNIDEIKPLEKKNYKFAIVIPNFNNDQGNVKGKTFLKKCIESVLNQKYKNFELIVVDDMSSDTSVETVENYVEKDERIHLIRNNRKRYNGGSRNVGIEYAINNIDFDYLVFLDSDDWYKDENVLQRINDNLWDCELMLLGLEMIFPDGTTQTKINEYQNYEEFFLSDNKTWCTAWCRVIRKDKIVYFPESCIMEDRSWSYEQADNVCFENIRNLKQPLYIWNRMNTTNSVSIVRDKLWEASAWKHIGEQKMLLTRLKHKEMIPIIEERIKQCIIKVNLGEYQQY